jgi:hypothetical protein
MTFHGKPVERKLLRIVVERNFLYPHIHFLAPKAIVHGAGFVFQELAGDLDVPMSVGEDFAAGQAEGRVFGVVAGQFQ